MADSSRVFEVGLLGPAEVWQQIRPAHRAVDILSERRPGWVRPALAAFVVAGLAMWVSATAMGRSGSTGEDQIDAVQAELTAGFAVPSIGTEPPVWQSVWSHHPELASHVPIETLSPTG
ncbi:MAG: hypothetical protein P8N02_14220, partial [Actinomycetota bacterium]|nr:hypothetical protein [Actinomycetota bacterium]